eukprot:CAMPEP_0184684060 /NCGR_PEP_ID=MMETSP0312-20130426/13649_1 /TAXON_ID=31354 /ORGANISM="Compsopogon coeruleus, Strain SAG 36.94" /LENGTH=47 /DNA_ID= /DNA_START= /DNA_END= /DNA_ORIENTATION=
MSPPSQFTAKQGEAEWLLKPIYGRCTGSKSWDDRLNQLIKSVGHQRF